MTSKTILHPSEIDAIDRAILRCLQTDGRVTNQALSQRVGLSPAACHKRLRRLEKIRAIRSYSAQIDRHVAGRAQSAFVQITLETQGSVSIEDFERTVVHHPEIIECHLMAGDYDYLLHVVVSDAAEYERIHRDVLTKLPHVARLQTSFSLRTVRHTLELPIAP